MLTSILVKLLERISDRRLRLWMTLVFQFGCHHLLNRSHPQTRTDQVKEAEFEVKQLKAEIAQITAQINRHRIPIAREQNTYCDKLRQQKEKLQADAVEVEVSGQDWEVSTVGSKRLCLHSEWKKKHRLPLSAPPPHKFQYVIQPQLFQIQDKDLLFKDIDFRGLVVSYSHLRIHRGLHLPGHLLFLKHIAYLLANNK